MEKGFVALLDVLGFSALVTSEGSGERLEAYLGCLKKAIDDTGTG